MCQNHPAISRGPRISLRLWMLLLGLFYLLGGGAPAAVGQGDPGLDRVALEAFMDGVLATQLRAHHVAGAVVAIVEGDETLLAKGYGRSNVGARIPADAETTLFRIGSISKLFIWTTVMQLVEEGKLDLHADVSTYLEGLEISDGDGQPITLAHLMTHTAGFEDWVVGIFGRGKEDVRPLREILEEQGPARVRVPGEVPSYSNHGAALAALIVETVAGEPWTRIVQKRVLEPLGMAHTSFEQPPPERIGGKLSKGYRFAGGSFVEQDFEWIPLAPTGAAVSTAQDMAKLLSAYLGDGCYGEACILEPETARLMQSDLLEVAPGVNPSTHGFTPMSLGGTRILGHGGSTLWFHSILALFPERKLGIFVSYNTASASEATSAFLELFVDRFFPLEPPRPIAIEPETLARYTGLYRLNRYSHTSIGKLSALVRTDAVTSPRKGKLSFRDRLFVPVGPRVFEERDGGWRLVFEEDEAGEVNRLYIAHLPIVAFERVPALEKPALHAVLLTLVVLALVGTLVAWPMGKVVRWWLQAEVSPKERLSRPARLVLWLAALVFLAFILGAAGALSDPNRIAMGEVEGLKALFSLPFLGAFLALVAMGFSVRSWWKRQGRGLGRIAYLLAVVAMLCLLWQLSLWNLLGWRF